MSDKANPVGWFEIPVKDMERAKAFYEHVFQFELQDHMMGETPMAFFPMSDKALGSAGSLIKHEIMNPVGDGILIYFSSVDLDASLERVEEKGGKIFCGKKDIGEYGYIGIVYDTEGNRIGLHTRKS